MEIFQFCLEIISREGQKFHVSFNAPGLKKITIASADSINFEHSIKRCHFLYRCGTINLYFAKLCFGIFLSDHRKVVQNLLSKWNNCADLTFCSISNGPALDYIAFLCSFREQGLIPPSFKNLKIVSKYGAWKNTVNIMNEIICEGSCKILPTTDLGNIKVVSGNPFVNFTQHVKSSIDSSDVIVMMQSLNLSADGGKQKKLSKSIKIFLEALKPSAILFCIDTEPSTKLLVRLLSSVPGKFLLKPTSLKTSINLNCPSIIKERVGCLPIMSTEGSFFIWEKSASALERAMKEFSESFRSKLNLNHAAEQDATKSSFDLSNDDQLLANSPKKCFENSNCFSPSSSSKNVLSNLKRENETYNEIPSVPELVTACVQTELEDTILQETERKGIIDLTHRIENLTAELSEMIEKNEPKCCENGYSIKTSEDVCRPSVPDDSNHPSASSCSNCIRNCEISSCQYCSFSQCCACDHIKMKAMSCGFEASKFSNCLSDSNGIISAENNSPTSSAQLVIPLTNLSADVLSQIILLLSQSNQRQMNKVDNQASS